MDGVVVHVRRCLFALLVVLEDPASGRLWLLSLAVLVLLRMH